MSAFASGPAMPADDLTTETSEMGKICEAKHRDLLVQLTQCLGGILANHNTFELIWFLQALAAISQIAADKADAIVEENRKKY